MQVSVETTDGLERRVHIQVPAQRVDDEVEARLKKFGKRAKVKGFRPGKVPYKVIKKQYGVGVRAEVINEVVNSTFAEAISQEKLTPAGGPKIEPSVTDEGQDLQYTAVFEIFPKVELQGLDKLKVDRPKAEIAESDIDRVIENLREQRAQWVDVSRAAKKGDQVTVDFSGTRDGEPVEGAEGSDVAVVLGEGRMLDDFEKGLTGLKAGDDKAFKVKFPKDYQAEELQGAKVDFEATAKVVQERKLPEIDDEFLAAFGVTEGGVDKLRADVKANMTKEMAQTIRADVKNQLMEQLQESNPIAVPEALINDEIGRLQQDAQQRLGLSDPSQVPPASVFEDQARRRVRLGLLMNELISKEKIETNSERVEQRLLEMAGDYQEPEQVVRAYRTNPDIMRSLESVVLEEQAIDWLLDKAKVKDKKIAFAKLMKLDNE